MPRLTFPVVEAMSDDQRKVYDATIAGRRGRAPANVMVWLRSPELAARAQRLGEFVRYETVLGPRLSELAILVVARHWTSHYEWSVHRGEALQAGVAETVVEAIASRQTPLFAAGDEAAVYAFASEIMTRHAVSAPTYHAAVAALGEKGVVELVGVIGYYTFVAMTLSTFEIEPAPGSPRLDQGHSQSEGIGKG